MLGFQLLANAWDHRLETWLYTSPLARLDLNFSEQVPKRITKLQKDHYIRTQASIIKNSSRSFCFGVCTCWKQNPKPPAVFVAVSCPTLISGCVSFLHGDTRQVQLPDASVHDVLSCAFAALTLPKEASFFWSLLREGQTGKCNRHLGHFTGFSLRVQRLLHLLFKWSFPKRPLFEYMALQSTIFSGPFCSSLISWGGGGNHGKSGLGGGYPFDSAVRPVLPTQIREMSCGCADNVYPPVPLLKNGWLNHLGGFGFFSIHATWICFLGDVFLWIVP